MHPARSVDGASAVRNRPRRRESRASSRRHSVGGGPRPRSCLLDSRLSTTTTRPSIMPWREARPGFERLRSRAARVASMAQGSPVGTPSRTNSRGRSVRPGTTGSSTASTPGPTCGGCRWRARSDRSTRSIPRPHQPRCVTHVPGQRCHRSAGPLKPPSRGDRLLLARTKGRLQWHNLAAPTPPHSSPPPQVRPHTGPGWSG